MNENFIDGKKSSDSKPGIIRKRLGKGKDDKLTAADARKLIARGRKMGGEKGKKIAGQGQFILNMVKEEAPAAANAVGHGGVDMTPGMKQKMMKKPLKRFKDFRKRWEDASRN